LKSLPLISFGGIDISTHKSNKAVWLDLSEKTKLCKSLESLVIRDRLIGTRAEFNFKNK
jgi:hypothetical protein